MKRPALSVIIPSYNRLGMLQRVLRALDEQVVREGTDLQIVVVDDCSSDGTASYLSRHRSRFDFGYHVSEKNGGPGRARNEAIGMARGERVLFLGDDILPDRHLVATHLDTHHRLGDPRVAVLGRTAWPDDIPVNTVMRHVDGIGAQQFSYPHLRHGSYVDYRHFYTSNISLPTSLLREQPYAFDLDFTLYGYEDIELGYRLAARGMRIYYESNALAHHYHPYTVYAFAERQYRAGRMACVLARKQPATRRRVGLDDVERAERVGRAPVAAAATRAWFEGVDGLATAELAVLRLAAFYELRQVPALDDLYIGLFKYFYEKGIAEGLREGAALEALHRRLLFADVAPVASWFLRQQARHGFPAPSDVLTWLAARRFIAAGAPRRPLWRRAAGRLKRALVPV